jgi:hypothetical protein
MYRAHLHLCCVGVLVLGCGEDRDPIAEDSGSTNTTTDESDSSTDTSTNTSDTETETETDTDSETETNEEDTSAPVCGDGIVDADEICDTGELADETCMSQGFDSGTLGCASDCMAFDTVGCGSCGNRIVDGTEACDGQDLGGETCESQGLAGTLTCALDCQLDLATCSDPVVPRLLLTQGAEVQERELDGTLLNSTIVPLLGGTEAELRELTHWDGVTYVYRGTFMPTMSHYDDNMAGWVHESFPGWSTVNNVSYGGLAHTQDWVWVTDMITAGAADTGLVRFSLGGLAAERVMDNAQYIDVFAGLDGLVYALRIDGDTVDVFDPVSGLPMGQILLEAYVRAIAVAQDGSIVGASFGGSLESFDEVGGLLMSMALGIESLVDVDLATDGTIAIGGSLGDVRIIDPELGNVVSSFDAGPDETFLEFLEAP